MQVFLAYLMLSVSLNIFMTAGQSELSNEISGSFSHSESSAGSQAEGEEKDCECVPYYQCLNNTFNTDGVYLIENRTLEPCTHYLEVYCCARVTSDPRLDAEDRVTSPSTPTHRHERRECGRRNERGVGGLRLSDTLVNESQFGEFPWMVAILKDEPCPNCSRADAKLSVYQCGGSLIGPQVVLTAAHCVYQQSPLPLKVRAGEWDTQTTNELLPHYDRRVKDIIVHDAYYAGGLHNDVALLVLDEPLEFQENVDIACLPEQDEVFDERDCFVSGWGKDVFGKEGKYQVILKKVQMPTVPQDVCQAALQQTRLGKRFRLHESFICAGGEKGKDACKVDGGSPLVCPIQSLPGHYVQVGIVAWGIGCGENGTPGVYVNVAKFRNWVDSKLSQLQLDSTTNAFISL